MIIYNEGNTPERQNPIFVDNQPTPKATIAAVISSYTLGNELLQAYKAGKNPTVDFKVYGFFEPRILNQVIAETRGGDPNNVVVVGAHLDSVPEGPGINDDGSGTATLLAQAEELSRGHYNLRQKIRFAWWGAEENGLVGSSYYAENLSDAEVKKIDVMLDYDMLASANYIRGIYDGDGDDPPEDPNVPNPPGPAGSGRVEDVFDEWFKAQGMKSERGAFDGRSDYVGFTLRGIPSGGVFAGAEGVKTAEQEAIYGGAAGAWYDPCYHQICDNLQTVITGVPPITADGLTEEGVFPDDAAKKAAARKMKGGALREPQGARRRRVLRRLLLGDVQGRLQLQAARRQAVQVAAAPPLARPRPPHQRLADRLAPPRLRAGRRRRLGSRAPWRRPSCSSTARTSTRRSV